MKYGNRSLREVGAFIDEDGNNFWGVEVHRVRGKQYVLASDRDYGLYICQPKPSATRSLTGPGHIAPD